MTKLVKLEYFLLIFLIFFLFRVLLLISLSSSTSLGGNKLTVESYAIIGDLLKVNRDLEALLLQGCHTPAGGAQTLAKALIHNFENDSNKLRVLEVDDVKLESHEGLGIIPAEILGRGSKRAVGFMLALFRSPKSSPIFRTKLILCGDEGSGKTTLLDCLFPTEFELTFSESFFSPFPETFTFVCRGKTLSRFARAHGPRPPHRSHSLCS